MKRGGGRAKGHAFERVVAGLIVKEFKKRGVRKKDCYRTPLSGGHRFASKTDPGDLVMSRSLLRLFPFSVECKFYKKIDLWPFLQAQAEWKKSWCVRKWLEQTCRACKGKKHVHPLLVFKQNNGVIMAALPQLMPLATKFRHKLKFRYNHETWYVVEFAELLTLIRRMGC